MAIENTHISYYELDRAFKKAKSVFFIGIGGISMSALAEYCLYLGKGVFGYDRTRGEECKRLEGRAHIRYCSTTDSVRGMGLVVFSCAIDENCFELVEARRLGILCVSRANFLGYIMADFKCRIGVSGMHGKSTTTAMLSRIFECAGREPTVICGAKMREHGSQFLFGTGQDFIFEACEYMNSFLNFAPTDAIVTNIDLDHPDFFTSLSQIKSSFQEYILGARRVFVNADDKNSSALLHPFKISFGIENSADYMAKIDTGMGKNSFSVLYRGNDIAHIALCELGRYNVYNALCAFAVASENGISHEVISSALCGFKGSERRQEYIKSVITDAKNGHTSPLFIDYAHHPTEIKASLSAFKDMGYKKILCVFQAHTYSRTYALYDEFLSAFKNAWELIITPIYSAREENTFPISDEGFASDLGAIFMSDYEEIAKKVHNCGSDLVVIMGAGDILLLKNYIN